MTQANRMTGKVFRHELPAQVRSKLPGEWQGFEHRSRFSLVQIWYEEPAFHFEIWPQRHRGVIEVGLHLEHRQPELNRIAHAWLDQHFVEIRHELGEVWLEKWDRGWHKLYATYPFTEYDVALLDQVSGAAARQIEVLQPLLVEWYSLRGS